MAPNAGRKAEKGEVPRSKDSMRVPVEAHLIVRSKKLTEGGDLNPRGKFS